MGTAVPLLARRGILETACRLALLLGFGRPTFATLSDLVADHTPRLASSSSWSAGPCNGVSSRGDSDTGTEIRAIPAPATPPTTPPMVFLFIDSPRCLGSGFLHGRLEVASANAAPTDGRHGRQHVPCNVRKGTALVSAPWRLVEPPESTVFDHDRHRATYAATVREREPSRPLSSKVTVLPCRQPATTPSCA